MNHDVQIENTLCTSRYNKWFRGIFFGDNPFHFDTPVFMAQLSVAALITTFMKQFLAPLGQSAFISQVLAGVILGPSFLGRNPELGNTMFPVSSYYTVDTFSFFGLMLFLFLIGVKTDLSLIRKCGNKALAIGVSVFSLPLLLNFAAGQIISRSVPMDPNLHRSMQWIASFQALNSFQVIICVLAELKLMNSDIGRLAASSSIVSGFCSWFWTILIFTGKQSFHIRTTKIFLYMLLFLGFMILIAVFVFRPIALWINRNTANERSIKESHVCIIFILILGSSLVGEVLGYHFMLGPMLLGVVIPDGPPLGSALVNKLEFFVSNIMLPIFFVMSGARIDFALITLRNFALILFLAFLAVVWKVTGVILPSLYCKMSLTDAFYLGLILSSQGIVEVLVLESARSVDLIDRQSYSIMVLSIVMFTGIISPVVKFSYKPYRKYTGGQELMTIQHMNPDSELQILACIHYQEHTHSLINFFEASYPNPHAPICFYVVHLVELGGRSAPVLIDHHPKHRISHSSHSDHIINALRYFENENMGSATVYPFTSISPYATMHDDVCSLAADKRVSLVIILFHKHHTIHQSELESNAVRSVNDNIIQNAPCSVGILIDQGSMDGTASMLSGTGTYRIGLLFLGGADDREALSYACRMAKHPNICLTLISFIDLDRDPMDSDSPEMLQDLDMLNEYRNYTVRSGYCEYEEASVKDSIGFVGMIRSLESCFSLILVGRRHDTASPLLAGFNDWNEYPELGCIGGLFVSPDSDFKLSVLVIQQMDGQAAENVRQDSFSVRSLLPWSNSGKRSSSSKSIAF